MSTSAYNIFRGVVKQVNLNTEGAEVTVEIAPGIEITSVVNRDLARQLRQAIGQSACVVIEAIDVMLATN